MFQFGMMEGKQIMDMANKQLRNLRISHGLTQRELAEATSISENSIRKWELGRSISASDILLLSDYFGVSCDLMIRGISSANLDIHENLGFNEGTIEMLKSRADNDYIRKPLNWLLSSGQFYEALSNLAYLEKIWTGTDDDLRHEKIEYSKIMFYADLHDLIEHTFNEHRFEIQGGEPRYPFGKKGVERNGKA